MTTEFIKEIEAKIRAEVPEARFSKWDYDFSLGVAHPTKQQAWDLVVSCRPDIDPTDTECYVVSPERLAHIIELLKS